VRQGDPLAFLCFCLGFQDPIRDINAAMVSKLGANHKSAVWAFADDATFFGPTIAVKQLCLEVEGILASYDLVLAVNKCIIIGPDVGDQRDNIFQVQPHGTIVVGNPIGSEDFRAEECLNSVTAMTNSLANFSKLHPHTGYTLLHHCINARPGYLARVCESANISGALRKFDDEVDRVVAEICGCVVSDELSILRELPQSFGGLGLWRHAGIGGQKARLCSRYLTLKLITEYFPCFLEAADLWTKSSEVTIDTNASQPEQGDEIFELSLKVQSIEDAKALAMTKYTKLHSDLLVRLKNEGRSAHSAWFRSGSSKSSARWLTWRGGLGQRVTFSKQQFVDALRLRLLRPQFEDNGVINHLCNCPAGNGDIISNPLHCFSCKHNGLLCIARHNAICDFVAVMIQQCWPDARVVREFQINRASGIVIIADIRFTRDNESKLIDVSVINPGAKRYLDVGSADKEDVGSNKREEEKRVKYSQILGLAASNCFVPFVVEATGRLGKAAVKFVNNLTKDKDISIRSFFLNSLSACLARFSSCMIANSRKHID
jgi:hypothetical protein